MKIFSSTCFGLLILCHIAGYVGFYAMGRLESGWLYLNPLILGLLTLLLFLGLIAAWVTSLIRRKNRIWTTVLFVGFPVLFSILPPEGATTVYGIRNRVMEKCTPDDLRHFARDVHQNLPNTTVTPWDTAELTGPKVEAYKKLQELYPFMQWGMGSQKGPSVIEGEGVVDVFWGGGLFGHWGFSITVDGEKNEVRSGPETSTLKVSDDINFYNSG